MGHYSVAVPLYACYHRSSTQQIQQIVTSSATTPPLTDKDAGFGHEGRECMCEGRITVMWEGMVWHMPGEQVQLPSYFPHSLLPFPLCFDSMHNINMVRYHMSVST